MTIHTIQYLRSSRGSDIEVWQGYRNPKMSKFEGQAEVEEEEEEEKKHKQERIDNKQTNKQTNKQANRQVN